MSRQVETPTPVLAVTARASGQTRSAVRREAAAALRRCATEAGLQPGGQLVEVVHGDPDIVEVCLVVERLPPDDPPPPVVAELLTPGLTVDDLDDGGDVAAAT